MHAAAHFTDDAGDPVGPLTQAYLSAMREQLGAIRRLLDLKRRLIALGNQVHDPASDAPAQAQALMAELGTLAPEVTAATDRVGQSLQRAARAWEQGTETEPSRERARLTAEFDQLVAAAEKDD